MSSNDEVDMEVESNEPSSELNHGAALSPSSNLPVMPSDLQVIEHSTMSQTPMEVQDKDPGIATVTMLVSTTGVSYDMKLSASTNVQAEVTNITYDKTSTESHSMLSDSDVAIDVMKQPERSPSSCDSSLIPAIADTNVNENTNLKDVAAATTAAAAATDVTEPASKTLQDDVTEDKTVVAAVSTETTNQAVTEADSENLPVVCPVLLTDASLQENVINDSPADAAVSQPTHQTTPEGGSDLLPVSPLLTDAADMSSVNHQETNSDDHVKKTETTEEMVCAPLGTPVDELPTNCDSVNDLPTLAQTDDHTILFDVESVGSNRVPEPFPDTFRPDKKLPSFQSFVNLPYYSCNEMCKTVSEALKCLIEKQEIEFSDVVCGFQSILEGYGCYSNLQGLQDYMKTKSDEECKALLALMKKIAALALDLPNICTRPIPLLRRQRNTSVSMSQKQAACLLANAFYCTYPPTSSYNLQHLTFCGLYRLPYQVREKSQFAKLDCIFNYFRRVFESMPSGVITFRRQVLKPQDEPDWAASEMKIIDKLAVSIDGRIERHAPGMLHVDFANKCVGGGMLGEGCVQEEILFMLCPELIISRLLAEDLDDNETLVMRGYERFSDYRGYAASFEFTGNYADDAKVDKWGRRVNEMVAMDALILWDREVADQLIRGVLKREMNKAFCGFRNSTTTTTTLGSLAAVATGNWGCGAFGGNPYVKFLIQLMAASQAQRPMFYFTFHDDQLAQDIIKVHESLVKTNFTVSKLFQFIVDTDVYSGTELYDSIIEHQPPPTTSTL